MTAVFISGANGYIGAHVAKLLISSGYKVVGSVRSPEKGEKLTSQLGTNFSYEIILSLTKEDSFDEVLKKHPEVTVFVHTASPTNFGSADPENEIIKPAIAGVVNALSSAQKYGNIKKFILTSSILAMGDYFKDKYIDETHWNSITHQEAITVPGSGYPGSKKFAEQAAWEFVEKQKPKYSFTVVNPVIVFGPVAFLDNGLASFGSTLNFTLQTLQIKENKDKVPHSGPSVDVRDVAKLHLAAIESEKLTGKRLIACTAYSDGQLVLDIARKYYPDLFGNLPKGTPGSSAAAAKTSVQVNNQATKDLTSIDWIPIETTFKDLIGQIAGVLQSSN